MSDAVKITVWVRTDKVGSICENEIEFDRDQWEAMSEQEREEAARDAIWNMAEWGWTES